jgi:NADPH:quinone reductase-like Zn-dependent oxidoreductase
VLVQGAGGGVATAAVMLAVAMGKRVYATSREGWKRERIAALGATPLEPGARIPERVGVVIESVGAPTFEHSMKCSAPGARIVVCGATAGHQATVDLRRVFGMRLEILGATMGTAAELTALLDFMVEKDVRPVIDSTFGFSAVADAFARLNSGAVFGKVAVDHLH